MIPATQKKQKDLLEGAETGPCFAAPRPNVRSDQAPDGSPKLLSRHPLVFVPTQDSCMAQFSRDINQALSQNCIDSLGGLEEGAAVFPPPHRSFLPPSPLFPTISACRRSGRGVRKLFGSKEGFRAVMRATCASSCARQRSKLPSSSKWP